MVFGKIRQKLNSKSSSEGTPWQRATAESERQKAQTKQQTTKNSNLQRLVDEKKAKLKPRKHLSKAAKTGKRQGYFGWYSIFLVGGHRQQFSDLSIRESQGHLCGRGRGCSGAKHH